MLRELDKLRFALFVTIQVLITMIVIMARRLVLVGSNCRVMFPEGVSFLYFSFSKEPDYEAYLDDFGVSDDEVFCYLDDWKQLIKYAWRQHDEGWTITQAQLVYADEVIGY